MEGCAKGRTAAEDIESERCAVGVDIGGTNLRAALVTSGGSVLREVRCSTPAGEGVEVVLSQVRAVISRVLADAKDHPRSVLGIGVGCPGLVDSRQGIVRVPPNLRGWDEVRLGDAIRATFDLRTVVANDVNAVALGELHCGAGRGLRDIICVTLGTGVGGAYIVGGKLHTGCVGTAGEIGHITVEPDGPQCRCGNKGCLESLIGASALVERTVLRLGTSEVHSRLSEGDSSTLTPKAIADAARKGDEIAAEIFREAGEYLGIVLAGLVNFLNPQAIIIGGGIANAGDLIFEPVRRTVRRRAYGLPGETVQIVPAQLGERAGVIGAATLVLISQH